MVAPSWPTSQIMPSGGEDMSRLHIAKQYACVDILAH
jgi:hypothetical protein